MSRRKDPRELVTYKVSLKLRVGADDDLIALLRNSSNMALLVKRALRGHTVTADEEPDEESYDDLLDELML